MASSAAARVRQAFGRFPAFRVKARTQYPCAAVLALTAGGGAGVATWFYARKNIAAVQCEGVIAGDAVALRRFLESGCADPQGGGDNLTVASSAQSSTGKVVLVTGAAGFIGYHCAVHLKKRGDGVIGIDNMCPYYPVSIKDSRADILKKEGIYLFEADLNERNLLSHIIKEHKVTHVLNLCAQAGVRYAAKDPASYVASNVAGFMNLLEAVRTADPQPSVVYASSSSVYGLNTKVPFAEEDRVDHPASLYAATKKANEMMACTYNHIYGISFIGLRFFTVYGPWGRPDMAAFSFTKKIESGGKVNIFQGPGGTELERDFTYIDDIVAGTVAALDHVSPSTKDTAMCKIYNLGNEDPVTVSYLVDCLEQSLCKKANRNYMAMPPTGDVLRTAADTTKAQRELGYKATTPLHVGIDNFIQWYKEYFKDGMAKDVKDYVPY